MARRLLVGEEFGPYILKFDLDGKLTDVIATVVDGKPVLSPDNPELTLQGDPSRGTGLQPEALRRLRRTGTSKDGAKLYGLLEGPLWADSESVEEAEGRPALRIIELDAGSKAWTGAAGCIHSPKAAKRSAISTMLDEKTALVIERDNGAGHRRQGLRDPKNRSRIASPSDRKLKRVYKIAMSDENVGKAVRKIGYVDLLKIADPDNRKRQGGGEGYYDMPFVTIENVDRVDETHIIVGNDHNLPLSAGRSLDRADDNEFVLLESRFLKAE